MQLCKGYTSYIQRMLVSPSRKTGLTPTQNFQSSREQYHRACLNQQRKSLEQSPKISLHNQEHGRKSTRKTLEYKNSLAPINLHDATPRVSQRPNPFRKRQPSQRSNVPRRRTTCSRTPMRALRSSVSGSNQSTRCTSEPARRFVVGVMGSGRASHSYLAEPLGRWLAASGVDLLTGGGQGVMACVSKAFATVESREGMVIGVIPGCLDAVGCAIRRPAGYPNVWVELPIYTHLPSSGAQGTDQSSRNHINVLSSDVIVALPGGLGTASEVALAKKYGKPVVAYLGEDGAIEGLEEDEVCVARTLSEVQEFVLGVRGEGG